MGQRGRLGPAAELRARGASAPLDLVIEQLAISADGIRVRVTGRLDRRPLGMRVPTFVCGRYLDLEADLTFRRESSA